MARRLLACAAAALALAGPAGAASAGPPDAAPRFAGVFSDHAVLQRDQPLPLWGEAAPGARLTVSVADQTLVTRADAQGRWRVTTTPLMVGGPYELKVLDDAGHGATLDDVLVGDVWLCSGQSNMELRTGAATNAWNEIHASANPELRFVNIARDAEPVPRTELKQAAQWKVAGPDTTGESSAVCYYMAKALQAAEKVPVGFINASWGGTPAEAWIPEPTLRRMQRYAPALDLLDHHAKDPSLQPAAAALPVGAAGLQAPPWAATSGLSVLYNGIIAPLAAYRLKGVAWYQGESNEKTPAQYQGLLSSLIADWRETFADPGLPFLVVQLPAYGPPASVPAQSAWARLREAQRRAVLATSGAGLAVTVDVGDRFDIHPGEKAVVGRRLALVARRVAYGGPAPGSPAPVQIARRGRDLVVTFSDADKGLVAYSSPRATGFEACDSDRACRFVEAVPEGSTVVLKGVNDSSVRFVRYAWADAPFVNLFNRDDLPATPFEMAVPPA